MYLNVIFICFYEKHLTLPKFSLSSELYALKISKYVSINIIITFLNCRGAIQRHNLMLTDTGLSKIIESIEGEFTNKHYSISAFGMNIWQQNSFF